MNNNLKTFLEPSYEWLEQMNIQAKRDAQTKSASELEKKYRAYLAGEKLIKAVTLCFSDIEGRFHMLDYDKKFFLGSTDNLTFDGSSIRGFSAQSESDLRLAPDWGSIRWLPADIFGPGKVIMFAYVMGRDGAHYPADFRGQLKQLVESSFASQQYTPVASVEIEGFLVSGVGAEQRYVEGVGFEPVTTGGYYHSLPLDILRQFIDTCAEAQRAMGFENEKDHPEVAPSQFEMNFSYGPLLQTADQIQLYKLVCRQVAASMGLTATFLPKPIAGVNGSGMHTNFSISKSGKNIFYDKKGELGVSRLAHEFISRILNHAPELCLIFNSSVNAYRRLDPHYEAPNQIKCSAYDRGSMIRIPEGNERSARIEVRSVAPDANPYLVLHALLYTGMQGAEFARDENKRERARFLSSSLVDAIRLFKSSDFISTLMGTDDVKEKFVSYKQMAANRCARELGMRVKASEVRYHHEVTNQMLWSDF